MERLKRAADRKVAASITERGTVRVANSFGLPSGRAYSCPGATTICERVCYAGKLERVRTNVREALMHNWDLVKDASYTEIYDLLNIMIMEFRTESERKGADKKFRIHWDGDFFNEAYTMAWHDVVLYNDDVEFWVYTRNSTAARQLHGIPNLTLYFSGDSENLPVALEMQALGIPVAMLGDTFADAREAIGRGAMCPEQRGQIPLNGACIACGICPKGNVNVLFSISKG